jgi:hypothetical protein
VDPHLVDDFKRLREACIDLRTLSNEFKILFADADKPTLDAAGAAVFQVTHDCMIETWWLRAGRLMDPAKSPKRENLTFANILDRMEPMDVTGNNIRCIWTSLRETWAKMKPARNKQLAHSDLETSRQDTWLGALSEGDDEAFEDNLQSLCDLIGDKLGIGPLDFGSSSCAGDATDLIRNLKTLQ